MTVPKRGLFGTPPAAIAAQMPSSPLLELASYAGIVGNARSEGKARVVAVDYLPLIWTYL